jgi:hypothetical protein
MLSIKKFKASLGEQEKNMTEKEIVRLRDEMNSWANLIFDCWLEERNKKKI